MSYILDALQRAESERERGHVPGLNSQIVPPPSHKTRPVRRAGLSRTAVAGALGAALLIAAGLWWWLGQTDETPIAMPAPAPATPAPASAPTAMPPVAAVTPAPAADRPAAPEPVQPILAPPRVEPAPKRPPASSPPASAAAPAAPPPAVAPAAPGPATTAKAPAAAPPAATADANAAPVRSFAELSPEARAQLPAVNVSGSTYSKNPALRMLIVNGKVLQEGQEIAPGFKLETIGQRSAVLNHNGLRYTIGY